MSKKACVSAMVACLVYGLAAAQGVPDPTRPPDAVAGQTLESASALPSGLQSIIRRQGAKSGAVINGIYVELGGKVGEATLERIGEDSVDLRSATGRETMYLTPGVGKKVVPTVSNVAKRPRGKLTKAKQ
jgi:MSHA biogenesis protein MshK